jgi:hypothetical protein
MMWGNADDPVKLWRIDANRREQEYAEAREQQKRKHERHERNVARAGAREEIAALEQRLAAVEQQLVGFNEVANATAKGFQGFARETSNTEVLDLPDFIRKMH